MTLYDVVVRRANGRRVRARVCSSHYSAKLLQRVWEAKYDWTHRVEIERRERES